MSALRNRLAFDRGSVRTIDADGRMNVAITNISKANVCPYKGSEIPDAERLGLDPNRIYNLFRDPDELAKAAPTFNNLPLLDLHVPHSADDPQKSRVVGCTGDSAIFVPPYLKNSLKVWDAAAIAGIESGEMKELSCAYRYTADMTPGVYEGMTFDGRMRDIVGNHVALVEAGRAGPDVIVGDEKPREFRMTKLKTRTALMMKGAVAAYVQPRLAADAKVDFGAHLGDLTRANIKTSASAIAAAIVKATKGKLAADAELDPADISDIVEAVAEAVEEDEDDDEVTGDADLDDDPKETDAERKIRLAKEQEEARDKKARDAKRAKDKNARDANPKLQPKRATDGDDPDEEDDDKDMDAKAKDRKKAMDSAIELATDAVVKRFRDLETAKDAVRPHVGAVVGMDSAEAVYKYALEAAGVDVKGVDPSAYPAMVKMLPAPGSAKPRMASDSANDDFAKRFPDLARVRQA